MSGRKACHYKNEPIKGSTTVRLFVICFLLSEAGYHLGQSRRCGTIYYLLITVLFLI